MWGMIRDSFKLAGFSICILAAQSAIASPCPTSNVIENPEPFVWTYHPVTANNPEAYYSGTLVAGEETFQIGSDTLTTRAYGQEGQPLSIPAPTMHLQPGEKYILRFENSLPYEAPNSSHNVLKDPNITNVHTHGLHISGESPGDDVTRSFEGGFGGDFVYDIPADHMGGTFWYHAHHHGSSYLQVAGGMLGLMVVDDSADGIPSNVAGMTEKELVVAYLDLTAAGSGGDTLLGGTLPSTWTVNGTVGGNICTPNNEWQHWRILLADPDANPKDLSVGAGCEVQLLARDGVWRLARLRAAGSRRASDDFLWLGLRYWARREGKHLANSHGQSSICPPSSERPTTTRRTPCSWTSTRTRTRSSRTSRTRTTRPSSRLLTCSATSGSRTWRTRPHRGS